MHGTGAPLDRKSVCLRSWGHGFPEYRTPMRQRSSFSFDVFDRKIHATSAPERRNISKPQEVFDDGAKAQPGHREQCSHTHSGTRIPQHRHSLIHWSTNLSIERPLPNRLVAVGSLYVMLRFLASRCSSRKQYYRQF